MTESTEYDVVLMGATGFTGRLVAEHLLQRHGVGGGLRWALAGRNRARLQAVREQLGEAAAELPLLEADSHKRDSLDRLVARTRVVCTTVGPYALHGSDLVAACAEAGTAYCDLSGEVPWMRQMLDAHAETAARSGARIVHCCGFDSIPSDLGVHVLQQQAMQRFGAPAERVRMRVKAARGGLSGGTYASMLNIVEQSRRDQAIARVLKNPYALCPPDAREGVRQPYVAGPAYDPELQAWLAPFIMAAINTRIVHRSNALSEFAYGRDFRYDEAIMTGKGWKGRARAIGVSTGMGGFALASSLAPTRALMKRLFLPKPGEGPSAQQREAGFFSLILSGRTAAGERCDVQVKGDRDPGYGATSRMIGEVAAALARDTDADAVGGGFWTPATALGDPLVERLTAHAGMRFEAVD